MICEILCGRFETILGISNCCRRGIMGGTFLGFLKVFSVSYYPKISAFVPIYLFQCFSIINRSFTLLFFYKTSLFSQLH